MKRSNQVFLLVTFLFAASFAAQDKRISIAVNDLMGQGIDQPTATTISERLRVELINTQAFRVMERSQMANILHEQGFQQTDCVDNSCIVQMGQLLGVEHMVMGTIGKVGSMYTISLRLVNVATGEVLYTASEDCRCEIEDVLTAATPRIAMKLELAVEKAIFGTLNIKSTPDIATILINNNKIGFTNYANDRFMPGSYQLIVQKPTYEPVTKEIVIERNKAVNIFITLEHTKAFSDSLRRATWREHIQKMVVRQIIIGGLGLVAAGVGYHYNTVASNRVAEYNQTYAAYRNAPANSQFNALWQAYQDKGKAVDEAVMYRNISYSVAGAFGVGFCISFLF
jgi:TolB-like protein